MDNQMNVEIEVKEGNLGEGNQSSILTKADMEVEQHLINGLKKEFPDHEFIGEESFDLEKGVENFTNSPTWIIDPIDGTMNFVHNNPLVCTSVGLTINHTLAAGVVHCPLLSLTYTA